MSIYDQINKENSQRKEECHNVALEHMVVLEQQRIAAESYYDPRVVVFKARRKAQALQERRWKPSIALVLPKKLIITSEKVLAGTSSRSNTN